MRPNVQNPELTRVIYTLYTHTHNGLMVKYMNKSLFIIFVYPTIWNTMKMKNTCFTMPFNLPVYPFIEESKSFNQD